MKLGIPAVLRKVPWLQSGEAESYCGAKLGPFCCGSILLWVQTCVNVIGQAHSRGNARMLPKSC